MWLCYVYHWWYGRREGNHCIIFVIVLYNLWSWLSAYLLSWWLLGQGCHWAYCWGRPGHYCHRSTGVSHATRHSVSGGKQLIQSFWWLVSASSSAVDSCDHGSVVSEPQQQQGSSCLYNLSPLHQPRSCLYNSRLWPSVVSPQHESLQSEV